MVSEGTPSASRRCSDVCCREGSGMPAMRADSAYKTCKGGRHRGLVTCQWVSRKQTTCLY